MSSQPNSALENRRFDAVRLYNEGMTKQVDIAAALGVSRQAVSRWLLSYKNGGLAGLDAKARSGRPSKLSNFQTKILGDVLIEAKNEGRIMTSSIVKNYIAQNFGVDFHLHHVPRLMRKAEKMSDKLLING